MVSIFFTRALAGSETEGHGLLWKSSLPFKTLSKICCSVSPQKGGTPQRRMYRMTPRLHTSASGP